MSVGLLALLDDVAALSKVAAASLDDVIGQAAKAGSKAVGAVIDDAAVAPQYVQGFRAERELPIVGKIALGSIKNKILILLPIALLLSVFAPQIISNLLMFGGLYLCYEGAHKLWGKFLHNEADHEQSRLQTEASVDAHTLEEQRIAGAIKTDFILSAEIMAISLGALPPGDVLLHAAALIVIAIAITVGVYGVVALIVKADDVGYAMAKKGKTKLVRNIGVGLVKGMPAFMKMLTIIGTAAMIWVGGEITIHGLAAFGWTTPEHWIYAAKSWAANTFSGFPGFASWLASAILSGVLGVVIGLITLPIIDKMIIPAYQAIRGKIKPKTA